MAATTTLLILTGASRGYGRALAVAFANSFAGPPVAAGDGAAAGAAATAAAARGRLGMVRCGGGWQAAVWW